MLPKATKINGYEQVAAILEAEIISGRLPIGSLLPIEADLAEALGVNRSTLREGLRALEGSGLVTRVAAKRLQISAPNPAQVAITNARALGLRGARFIDLWEVQMQLEPFLASLAAVRITEAHKHELESILAPLPNILEDDSKVIAHDLEFHAFLGKCAANAALELACGPASILLFSATKDLYRALPAARHRLAQAHQMIAHAIVKGEAEAAETWMRRHIADFKRGYELAGFDTLAPIDMRRAEAG